MPADKDAPRSTPFGLYERSQRPRLTGIEWSALFFSALWLGISGYFVLTLPPGGYTVVTSGVANTTGTALVEVYDLDP